MKKWEGLDEDIVIYDLSNDEFKTKKEIPNFPFSAHEEEIKNLILSTTVQQAKVIQNQLKIKMLFFQIMI